MTDTYEDVRAAGIELACKALVGGDARGAIGVLRTIAQADALLAPSTPVAPPEREGVRTYPITFGAGQSRGFLQGEPDALTTNETP